MDVWYDGRGYFLWGGERWVELCLAIGSAVSNGWGGRPMEWERVREAMGEVILGLGWCIIK